MEIEVLPVGPLQTNCYVLCLEKQCFIVDPGGDAEIIKDTVSKHDQNVTAILLTHGHFDHIGGVPELAEHYGCPVILHEDEERLYQSPANCMPPIVPPVPGLPSTERKMPTEWPVTRIHTPGHSPGSVCYWFENDATLIAGDTLFCQGVGRTDLPGGDHKTMINSITTRILTLPEATRVYPGHGPPTTVGDEKRLNPFLRSTPA